MLSLEENLIHWPWLPSSWWCKEKGQTDTSAKTENSDLILSGVKNQHKSEETMKKVPGEVMKSPYVHTIFKSWLDFWANRSDFEAETTFKISQALSRLLEQTSRAPFQPQITCYSVTILISSVLQSITGQRVPCQNTALSLLDFTVTARKWLKKGGWKGSEAQRAKPDLECHNCSVNSEFFSVAPRAI